MYRSVVSKLNNVHISAQRVSNLQKSTQSELKTIQRRDFFSFSKNILRQNAKDAIDANPSEENILRYVQATNLTNPKEVIITIEKGWNTGKIPINEAFIKEYFKAAAKVNKLDSINITSLLAVMAKRSAADGQTPLSDPEISHLIRSATMNSSNNSGSGGFSAGKSPEEPLHVINQVSWKSEAFKLLGTAVVLFMLASFVSGALDEKAPGSPGGGGLASRLGMGSVVHRAENPDKTFDDVVGIDEAKGDLQEIVMYLRDPKKFTRLGGKLPKGVLLTGPPGTGKTLLARAIAGEAKVPFFHTSGSEFEEMFVGVGAKRVRELFEAAKQKSPSIIFIDEIDAIGGKRELKDQSAMKMTLNQLLVEMDGFEQNTGVIVIAATNFPDSLDRALIRPGRFDKHVDVPMPDIGGRKAILELYGKKVPMDRDVDMEQLARGTPGFSGAELFNLINQAALKASVDNLNKVGMAALEYAKDKIMMGAERKSAVISPETMRTTAFHEAGHALVALKTSGADPIHKATIMPRGRALGMVMQLPDGDQTSMSRKQMLARLDVCMGGRVAEELVFGYDNVTSGASSDIQQATRLAHAMVTKYGLSDKVGVIFIDEKEKQSGETQGAVDKEVKDLLNSSYNRAKTLLELHRKDLDTLAKGLLQYESLAGGEIVDLLNGKPLGPGVRSQKPSRATQVLPNPRSMNNTSNNTSSSNTSTSSSTTTPTTSAKNNSALPSATTDTTTTSAKK